MIFWRIAGACAQRRLCKKPVKTYGFPRFFVGRAFFEAGSAVESKSMQTSALGATWPNFLEACRPVWRANLRLETSLEGQVESKLRSEASLASQVESKLALESGWTALWGPRRAAGSAC